MVKRYENAMNIISPKEIRERIKRRNVIVSLVSTLDNFINSIHGKPLPNEKLLWNGDNSLAIRFQFRKVGAHELELNVNHLSNSEFHHICNHLFTPLISKVNWVILGELNIGSEEMITQDIKFYLQ
jgi:hypothetical protein